MGRITIPQNVRRRTKFFLNWAKNRKNKNFSFIFFKDLGAKIGKNKKTKRCQKTKQIKIQEPNRGRI